jgi:predicted nucleic acid-binding protein
MQQSYLGLTQLVWIEALEGATNRQKQNEAVKLLRRFQLVEIKAEDMDWATAQLLKYSLSHNVDGYDCMIAAVSYRLQVPLFNRNMKHFSPLLGSLASRPY